MPARPTGAKRSLMLPVMKERQELVGGPVVTSRVYQKRPGLQIPEQVARFSIVFMVLIIPFIGAPASLSTREGKMFASQHEEKFVKVPVLP